MLTINILREAYGRGFFPMAESALEEAEIFWCRPPKRAVFLPEHFHIPRRLARLIRSSSLTTRWNDDFAEVMNQCGNQRKEGSWINPEMLRAYTQWHHAGEVFCLSVFEGEDRVGGIYGVQRGGVFMAESMFSRRPNASSIALIALMAGLVRAGIEMVDVQFENPHLTKFHPVLLSRKEYEARLALLILKKVVLRASDFYLDAPNSLTQSLTQTS